ncbi:DUF2461 domain-containing protein [Telmatospirillum sp.]|uniref:DUF2461 domain-containing protein n=1 Tax=Telmatospirillum sp. TaxID=2079197 RepID=UPI002841F7EB|nr:DUF2461 domain-containing protein [Telmatospirillum sp.]MDR3439635.1 DUF2461 domain-containing protein [Telmatospirillum sp.]
MGSASSFRGFSPEAVTFLRSLALNNDRAWFADHKTVYQTEILAPMRQLVADLGPTMTAIDPGFDTDPRGAAVSRIFRDTRFSRDKSPYRVNQWISFKHRTKDWTTRPAFFMEFRPEGYRHGMGYYAANAATMAAVRRRMAVHPERLQDAMETAEKAGYGLEGELYKRPRLPADLPPQILDWFRRKNVYVVKNEVIDATFHSEAIVELLRNSFRASAQLYRFLADAGRIDGDEEFEAAEN